MKYLIPYIFFIFFTVSYTFSQGLKPVRLEIPGTLEGDIYKVVPVGKTGVIVFYESSVKEQNKREWYFALLDTKLKQKWLKKVKIEDYLVFVKSAQTKNKVYFLFRNATKTGEDYDIYKILILDKKSGDFMNLSGSIPLRAKIFDFRVIENMGFIALNKQGFTADMAFVDLVTGEITPVHLDKETGALIESVHADRINKRLYVVVKYYNKVTYFKDVIYAFDIYGKKLFAMESEYPNNLRLPRNHKFVKISSNEIDLVGTYDLITGKRPDWKDVTADGDREKMTAGFFYMRFLNGKQKSLNFYDFLKFGNIHNSFSGNQIKITTGTGDDKKSESNKKVNIYYQVNNPKVTPFGDESVFSVELYKPYYITETRMDYDFYGRMYPYTYEVFAGYEFYDVIFAGFNEEGKMLWNNDFPVSDMLTYSLEDHIALVPDPPLLTLAYVTKGKLVSQTFDKGKDLTEREKEKIPTMFKRDRIVEDENNKIVHWYDNFYLVYGYQKIRNRALKDKSLRTVFYINKIAFQ